MKGFGSDNHAAVHPRIMQALAEANKDHAPSYGTDSLSLKAQELFRDLFGESCRMYFAFNGTAANVLALSALVRPHHCVLVSDTAHLFHDECGAPEKNLGARMLAVPSDNGKLSPQKLNDFLVRRGDQHVSQVRAISITQPTEVGTVYSIEEIRDLAAFAKKNKLYLHMDGARVVNAAASLDCSFRAFTTDCGIDALSFGGTKNGLMFGEAVVFLNPALHERIQDEFKYTRKQLMQLPSKSRYLAAQFLEFLGTDLWLLNARHANAMAKRLADGLSHIAFAEITRPCQANAVFVKFPKSLIQRLKDLRFFYVWDERTFECRLMTSWDTTIEEIDAFIGDCQKLTERPLA